jgi:hypothetical protein
MPSRPEQEQLSSSTKRQGDGDPGTRSGQPNPQDVPSHPNEHKSSYGGEFGSPKTSTEKRENPEKS